MISYRTGNDLDLAVVRDLYRSCSLGVRRPIEDQSRLSSMLANANLVITAWDGDLLVGISRSMTDFAFVTYLADLAVRETHQGLGIGKELIRRTQGTAPLARIYLVAAPAAAEYYPHIGFSRVLDAWSLAPDEQI